MNIKKSLVIFAATTAVAVLPITLTAQPARADWNTPWFNVDLGWGDRTQAEADGYCRFYHLWYMPEQALNGQWFRH